MQISSQPHISPVQSRFIHSYIDNQQSFHTSQENKDVQYSDRRDTVMISLSNTSIYMEATYYNSVSLITSEPSSHDISGLHIIDENSIIGTTPKIENADEKIEGNILNQYLEIIRSRVKYILEEISDHSIEKSLIRKSASLVNTNNLIAYRNTYNFKWNLRVSETFTTEGPGLEGSYFSPEKTAERIVQFALSFYQGGDRKDYASKVHTAVMKGVYEAQNALGGFLPNVTYKTITLVNQCLDNFAAGENISFSA